MSWKVKGLMGWKTFARSYNKQVKFKEFKVCDLVLRLILPMEQRSRIMANSPQHEKDLIVSKMYSPKMHIV